MAHEIISKAESILGNCCSLLDIESDSNTKYDIETLDKLLYVILDICKNLKNPNMDIDRANIDLLYVDDCLLEIYLKQYYCSIYDVCSMYRPLDNMSLSDDNDISILFGDDMVTIKINQYTIKFISIRKYNNLLANLYNNSSNNEEYNDIVYDFITNELDILELKRSLFKLDNIENEKVTILNPMQYTVNSASVIRIMATFSFCLAYKFNERDMLYKAINNIDQTSI